MDREARVKEALYIVCSEIERPPDSGLTYDYVPVGVFTYDEAREYIMGHKHTFILNKVYQVNKPTNELPDHIYSCMIETLRMP